MGGLIGVLTLGVIAVMVWDFTSKGSQGPAVIKETGTAVSQFYGSLHGA